MLVQALVGIRNYYTGKGKGEPDSRNQRRACTFRWPVSPSPAPKKMGASMKKGRRKRSILRKKVVFDRKPDSRSGRKKRKNYHPIKSKKGGEG